MKLIVGGRKFANGPENERVSRIWTSFCLRLNNDRNSVISSLMTPYELIKYSSVYWLYLKKWTGKVWKNLWPV